jgi:ATP-dependent DNA helicase RecQ
MEHYTKISETQLAGRLNTTEAAIKKQLKLLQQHQVLTYIPASDKPSVTFLSERMHENNLFIDAKFINLRKKAAQEQTESMIHFTEQEVLCRQQVICNYFGEVDAANCGRCDVCLEHNKRLKQHEDFKKVRSYIAERTKDTWVKAEELLPKNAHFAKQLYKEVIRFMLDEQLLIANDKNELKSK